MNVGTHVNMIFQNKTITDLIKRKYSPTHKIAMPVHNAVMTVNGKSQVLVSLFNSRKICFEHIGLTHVLVAA